MSNKKIMKILTVILVIVCVAFISFILINAIVNKTDSTADFSTEYISGEGIIEEIEEEHHDIIGIDNDSDISNEVNDAENIEEDEDDTIDLKSSNTLNINAIKKVEE